MSQDNLHRPTERDYTLLIIEDDERMRRSYADYFRHHGHRVIEAGSAEEAAEVADISHFDLAIVDWSLPGTDGVAFCTRLRAQRPDVPIVLLTGRADLDSQLEGYTYGVDDYWTKPFPLSLALVKVQALLRRHNHESIPNDRISFGDVVVDLHTRTVQRDGQHIELSDKEFGILRALLAEKGAPVRRQALLARVWGYESLPVTRTVDNYIVALRRKIEDDPAHPKYVLTVNGIGYRLHRDAK
ncbi:MAG: response regulator transcription factor [Candidatus Kapabacteria bacterium]|nr:response regulator transcription factor [Candidatus Kapabacteria bacterium]